MTQLWYVIQVMSAHEKKVKKSLEENREIRQMNERIEQVLLPIEYVSEVKKGEQRVVEKRLWPGYLLLKMDLDDEAWMYVKSTPGVIDFLGGEKPTPLTEHEVNQILKDIQEKKETVVQKHQFQIGDRVKIVDGVFVNFIGTITDVFPEKGRINVLVSIFGRDTQVDDLEFYQVEEVTDED